jgi:hypothetical protein
LIRELNEGLRASQVLKMDHVYKDVTPKAGNDGRSEERMVDEEGRYYAYIR